MPNATAMGKVKALKALQQRRQNNKDKDWRKVTADLPAGSPMYFGCIACNAAIVVPESYTTRSKLCGECTALKELGWLEE